MSERAAAQFILAQRNTLAEVVVARQYDSQPELAQRYGEGGRAKCVQDTDYSLAYLAAALNYSSPVLFTGYVAWAKTVLAVRNVRTEDVEKNLRIVWSVLQEQLPGGTGASVRPYLEEAFRTHCQSADDLPTLLAGDDPITVLARQYLQALLRTDRHEASRLSREAFRAGVSVSDLYLQMFQRCQREVGRLGQLNQLTVAQEHYCTAATQFVMTQLYPLLFSPPKTGRRLVAGEFHEVGLRIVTDLFEANGWDSVYLGGQSSQPKSDPDPRPAPPRFAGDVGDDAFPPAGR